MKQLLTLCAFLSIYSSQGQTDHFSEPSSKWFVKSIDANANMDNPFQVDTTTIIYGFEGDTLIENITWLKMYSTLDSAFQESLNFEGYIQSNNGIVEFLSADLDLDTLYDFNLLVGDSLFYDFGFDQEFLSIVESNEEIILGNNHIVLTFEEPILGPFYVFESWIEGIGSVHGPLFPFEERVFEQEIPDGLWLACTHVNQAPYWVDPDSDSCFEINVTSITEALKPSAEVKWSVANSKLNITSSERITSIKLMNLSGQTLNSKNINAKSASLDLSYFRTHIFILKVELSSGEVKVFKVVEN